MRITSRTVVALTAELPLNPPVSPFCPEVPSSPCPFRHIAPLHLAPHKHDPIWDCGKVAADDGVAKIISMAIHVQTVQ